jgi:transcription antitermination factor NusG
LTQTPGSDRWFALFVRVNHEKLVSTTLRSKGFEEFLPLYQEKRRWSDRTKRIESPLFPGYVFCRFDLNHRLPILTTPGVHAIVGNGKVPIPVALAEIENLRLIVDSRLQANPWPYLKVGQQVRIDEGCLEGLEGILVSTEKPNRVVVSVSLLQRSVAVEIDEAWIRPVKLDAARMTRLQHAAAHPVS